MTCRRMVLRVSNKHESNEFQGIKSDPAQLMMSDEAKQVAIIPLKPSLILWLQFKCLAQYRPNRLFLISAKCQKLKTVG